MEKISVGDVVIIIRSPYNSVPNGTIRNVEGIYRNHDGLGHDLYKLSDLPNQLFWNYEIKRKV